MYFYGSKLAHMNKSFLAFTLFIILLNACALSDIRPFSKTEVDQGRAKPLMIETAKRHGMSYWDGIETYAVHYKDCFYGLIGFLGSPYPSKCQEANLMFKPGDFNGFFFFKNGKKDGHIWAHVGGQSYCGDDLSVLKPVNKKDITFWVPTVQYFIELPWRNTGSGCSPIRRF